MQIVGIDIGGSKTHAVSRTQNGTVEVFAGSANLSSVGEVEAGRQLDAIFVQLAARGPIGAVCAGAAGVDTPESEERLRQLIAARSPAPRSRSSMTQSSSWLRRSSPPGSP